jgi:two-component system chemotaxis response regulator CheB
VLPDCDAVPVGDPRLDVEVAFSGLIADTGAELLVSPAGYGCPACGGGLFELPDSPVPRYRCRIGHAWSPESLLAEQAVATEGALLMALRALEEKSALSRRMAGSRASRPYGDRFERMAVDADHAGTLIRDLIARLNDHPV